ncbi:sulfotransferase family protein [Thiolapillus brandeum]|uniref:Sulfotransferase family protein n=1 Tax=Thiolapillus brandeum TaxID=1076588 RepID=A0A7U6GJ06_9GAMM|nr:sulfotransferase family 2 domain-containing protein [Thiolapillus brandeum]BAO44507.1 hypothetical protein TBH_C1590 [Thiolapillus brandeum]
MEREDRRPWYFLHIPKTAGTTFRVLLENQFHMDAICPAYEFFQMKPYDEERLREFRLFRGHMGYSLVNYLPVKPRVLVMLRDPMERTVSHFEYIRRDPAHPKHRMIHERKMGLKEYLQDPVLSAEVTNAQVRPLAHLANQGLLRELLDATDSQDAFARAWRHREGVLPPDDELLDVALERLEAADFVGVAERLEQGMALAARLLGAAPPQHLQSLNINPRRTRLDELPDDVLDLLQALTRLDRKLYQRGLVLFEGRFNAMQNSTGSEDRLPAAAAMSRGETGVLTVDFAQPLRGDGWHQRELVPGKGVLRWTGPGTESSIDLSFPASQAYRLRIAIADWVSETVLHSLRLYLDDTRLPVELVGEDGQLYALADIHASLVSAEQGTQRLYLRLDGTETQAASHARGIDHSHSRKLGISVQGFEFIPA